MTAAMARELTVSHCQTPNMQDNPYNTTSVGTNANCPKAYRKPGDNFAIVGCSANNVSTANVHLRRCLSSYSYSYGLQVNLTITFCD